MSTAENSFPSCQLSLTGCFPPCCGGNATEFTIELQTDNHIYTSSYDTNNGSCTHLTIPYYKELQDVIYNATAMEAGNFHLMFELTKPNGLYCLLANFSYNDPSTLLCKTHCCKAIPLPSKLRSTLAMIDTPCRSVMFEISFANGSQRVVGDVDATLGGASCTTSSRLQSEGIIAVSCPVDPYAVYQELVMSTSTLGQDCPDLNISDYHHVMISKDISSNT